MLPIPAKRLRKVTEALVLNLEELMGASTIWQGMMMAGMKGRRDDEGTTNNVRDL